MVCTEHASFPLFLKSMNTVLLPLYPPITATDAIVYHDGRVREQVATKLVSKFVAVMTACLWVVLIYRNDSI